MDANAWALAIGDWCEERKGDMQVEVRKIGLQIIGRLIELSPVGDPKRWKINEVYAAHRLRADTINAQNRAANGGRLKKGQKVHAQALIQFETKKGHVQFMQKGWAAKNYVGGRFRGNWQVTFDKPAATAIERIDKAGTATLEAGNAVLAQFNGEHKMIWFVNNVPYAARLEHGWSKQAPTGIVRLVYQEMIARGLK